MRLSFLCVLTSLSAVGCGDDEGGGSSAGAAVDAGTQDADGTGGSGGSGGVGGAAGTGGGVGGAAGTGGGDAGSSWSSCTNDDECKPDQLCIPTPCEEVSCPKYCAPTVAACTLTVCGPEAHCTYYNGNSVCRPRGQQGAYCDPPAPDVNPCVDGLFCKENEASFFDPGTCTPELSAGASCPHSGLFVCEPGYACEGAFGSTLGTCEEVPQLGDPCGGTNDCDVGLVCDTDITWRCLPKSGVGGDCYPSGGSWNEYSSWFCETYLQCVLPSSPGACASDADCPQLKDCCGQPDNTGQCGTSMTESCHPPVGTCQTG